MRANYLDNEGNLIVVNGIDNAFDVIAENYSEELAHNLSEEYNNTTLEYANALESSQLINEQQYEDYRDCLIEISGLLEEIQVEIDKPRVNNDKISKILYKAKKLALNY